METIPCKDVFKISDSSVSYFQNFTNILPGRCSWDFIETYPKQNSPSFSLKPVTSQAVCWSEAKKCRIIIDLYFVPVDFASGIAELFF